MHDIAQLRQRANNRPDRLSPSGRLENPDSMDLLRERTSLASIIETSVPQGNPEHLLACAGSCVEPGELKEML